jgi:hypothetical protein
VGEVESIHISATAGGSRVSRGTIVARRAVELLGDRYAAGPGYWRDTRVSRDLTLVESEVVDDLRLRGIERTAGALRRNITTRGIRLNDLLDNVFWVGDVLCRAPELCEPRHLEELTEKRLLRTLVHRGGIRAQLLTDGILRVGDSVERTEVLPGVGCSSGAATRCCSEDAFPITARERGRSRAASRTEASHRFSADCVNSGRKRGYRHMQGA